MTTWHYAFAREQLETGEDFFTLREVYVGDGKLSWSGPMSPSGETYSEIGNELALMGRALGRPVLDLTLDPPALVDARSVYQVKRDLRSEGD